MEPLTLLKTNSGNYNVSSGWVYSSLEWGRHGGPAPSKGRIGPTNLRIWEVIERS